MRPLRAATAVALVATLLAACSGAASPTGSPSPLPSAAISITTPAEAAARVGEVAPGLAGITGRDPDVIGACCFWEAVETEAGYTLTYEVGWGDCPSGCIERHHWVYAVSRDGAVTLVSEDGSPVPSGVPGAGSGSGGTGGGILPGGSGIEGAIVAGPTCPVVSANDSACDDRPVAAAVVVVLDATGREVARVAADAGGRYAVTLPPGPYTIEPQPVEGYMGTAAPVDVLVGDGIQTVNLAYDTGIR
jgi:hypothetical protein